jgi:hypothetical protein
VVVAFHRIREAPESDGLSVSTRMFERLCRFFMREFRVVPLRDIVERLERGTRLDHHLAITFDDGYTDNFENAMPVLEALSLPATFFVVSGWVSTATVPWWDRQAGVRYPLMTWDEVRTLHRKGFDIGGHTRTHLVSPVATKLKAEGREADLEGMFLKWSKVALSIGIMAGVFLMVLGPAFIGWWIDPSFARPSGAVLQILMLSSFVFLPVSGVALPVAWRTGGWWDITSPGTTASGPAVFISD